MSAVKELADDLFKDVRDDIVDKIFGEAKLFAPRTFKLGKQKFKPVSNAIKKAARELERGFARQRDLTGHRHGKRGRALKSFRDLVPQGGKSPSRNLKRFKSLASAITGQSQRSNMPHGSRSRMRNRGSVKSRSRNIRSNLTESRPMRIVAKRSQFAEVKYGTQSVSLTNGLMTLISDPAQGDANNERIGDEIRAQGLSIQLQAYKQTGSTVADLDQWRFTVFQWLPNSTVAPTIADIFTNVPAGQPARQFFNLQRRPLYKILYDVSGALTGDVATLMLGNSTTGIQKVNLSIPNKTISYDPGTDNGVNNVYVLYQSASTAVATPPLGQMTYRFTYTDQ